MESSYVASTIIHPSIWPIFIVFVLIVVVTSLLVTVMAFLVCQPSGEHVASLTVISRAVDGIQHPIGTAVNEDGFVYVCDYIMGTVAVF